MKSTWRFLQNNKYFFIPYLFSLLLGACLLWLYPTGYWVKAFAERRSETANIFFRLTTMLGEAGPLILAILWFVGKKEKSKALALALSGPLAILSSTGLKQIFSHPRPSLYFSLQTPPYIINSIPEVSLHTGYNSFPSGHTLMAFTLFALLTFLARKKPWGLLFFAAAFLTALSRIYLGQHFLKDVYAGSITGLILACLIYALHQQWRKKSTTTIVLLLVALSLQAQSTENRTDTTVQLPAVVLAAPAFSSALLAEENDKRQNIKADSLDLLLRADEPLGDLLSLHAAVKLRNYAPGMLSTISLRGSGAQHLLTVWNGLPLKNPMNGTNDLSLLPMALIGDFLLLPGGGSADDGPGAVGGVLSIRDRTPDMKGKTVSLLMRTQVGSFNLLRQSAQAYYLNTQSTGGLRWHQSLADNDYNWEIGNQKGRQKNNFFSLQGFSAFQKFYTPRWGRFSLHLWQQAAFRQIPPSRTEINTQARQKDRHFRWVVDWQKNAGQNWLLGLKIGGNREWLDYQSKIVPPGPDTIQTEMLETRLAKTLSRSSFYFALRQMRERAWSDNISESGYAARITQSMQTAYHQNLTSQLSIGFSANWQRTNRQVMPPAAALFLALKRKKIHTHLRLTQNFNLPTFNDLYWNGGYARGNPNLKPELARSAEWMLKWKVGSFQIWQLSSITHTRNLILWQNGANGWSPQNIREVLSPEFNAGLSWSVQHWTWRSEVNFGDPRIRRSEKPDDPALGHRLLYYPAWRSTSLLSYRKGAFQSALGHSYTGKRFTTTDNTQWLNAWQQFDFSLSYTLFFAEAKLELKFQLLNLFNKNHEFFPYRPLPGRQWRVSLALSN